MMNWDWASFIFGIVAALGIVVLISDITEFVKRHYER